MIRFHLYFIDTIVVDPEYIDAQKFLRILSVPGKLLIPYYFAFFSFVRKISVAFAILCVI